MLQSLQESCTVDFFFKHDCSKFTSYFMDSLIFHRGKINEWLERSSEYGLFTLNL